MKKTEKFGPNNYVDVCSQFSVDQPELILQHEKAAFNIHDEDSLKIKFCQFANKCHEISSQLTDRSKFPLAVVQETGGFISLLSTFYVARSMKIPHLFVEPAIFKGRIFFILNSWKAPAIDESKSIEISENVREYIQKATTSKTIVVPKKDANHYKSVTKKIVNPKNFRRLIEKTWDKHVLGKSEEFSHIGYHVLKHLKMAYNTKKLKSHYREFDSKQPFLYYPFHVPADMALTIRAPQYLDQFKLIEKVAAATPESHLLYIKEHPALVGAIDAEDTIKLVKKFPRLRLINPFTNNHEILEKADLVVTVNSKSGAEALFHGSKVLALGDSCYAKTKAVQYVEGTDNLNENIQDLLASPSPRKEDILSFFTQAWVQSHEGEIFQPDLDSVKTFTNSMLQFFEDHFSTAENLIHDKNTVEAAPR